MDYSQKLSILLNDLVRRLLNTKESLSQGVKNKIINDYSLSLLRLATMSPMRDRSSSVVCEVSKIKSEGQLKLAENFTDLQSPL